MIEMQAPAVAGACGFRLYRDAELSRRRFNLAYRSPVRKVACALGCCQCLLHSPSLTLGLARRPRLRHEKPSGPVFRAGGKLQAVLDTDRIPASTSVDLTLPGCSEHALATQIAGVLCF